VITVGLANSLPHGLPSPEPERRTVTAPTAVLPLAADRPTVRSRKPGSGPQAALSLLAGLAHGTKALVVAGQPAVLTPLRVRPTLTRRLGWVFATPTVEEIQPPGPPRPAIRTRVVYGQTVWRDPAGWHVKFAPTARDLEQADRVYGGGRNHPLSDVEIAELTTAGFGDHILLEPVR
jgi:hypothetical protein